MSGGGLGIDGFLGLSSTAWPAISAIIGILGFLWVVVTTIRRAIAQHAARRPDLEALYRNPRPQKHGSHRAPWATLDNLARMERPETEIELDIKNLGDYSVHLEKTLWLSGSTTAQGTRAQAYDLDAELTAGSSHTLVLTVPKRLIDGRSGGVRIYFTSSSTRRRRHYLFVPVRLGSWDDTDVPGPRLYGQVFLDIEGQKVSRNQKHWMKQLEDLAS